MSQVPFLQLYRIELFGWNYSVILYHVSMTVQNARHFYTIRSTLTRVYICLCMFNFFQPIVTAIPNYSHRVESPVLKYFDRITCCDISGSFSLFWQILSMKGHVEYYTLSSVPHRIRQPIMHAHMCVCVCVCGKLPIVFF